MIDHNEGGRTICYNDGIIPFGIGEKYWAKGGMFEDTVVAMFRPLDRE